MTTEEKEDALIASIKKLLTDAEEDGIVAYYSVSISFNRIVTHKSPFLHKNMRSAEITQEP